jgi:hypothetical protein
MKLLKLIIKQAMFFLYGILTKKNLQEKSTLQDEERSYTLTEKFTTKFLEKETDDLYGAKLENFQKIFYLFTILFLAGGFGWQSYQYIKEKLNDPFVKTIEVQNVDKVDPTFLPIVKDSLLYFLREKDTMSYYKIKSINSFEKGINFTMSSSFKTKDYYGRSIDFDSPLLKNILDENNKIVGSNFKNINDRGIILTSALLSELYLSPENITTITVIPKNYPNTLRIPILAVVKKLPKGSEFLLLNKYVDHFYWSPEEIYNFNMLDTISIGIDGNLDPEQAKSKFTDVIGTSTYANSVDVKKLKLEPITAINPGLIVKLPVTTPADSAGLPLNSLNIVTTLQNQLAKELGIEIERIYPAYEKCYSDKSNNYTSKGKYTNSIELTFDKLNKVIILDRSLTLWSETELKEIAVFGQQLVFGFDLESITLRDILKIVGFLIFTFLLIITILSIVSIFTIIKVVFEKYFQKIDKNIGTFKAFGINIKGIYRKVLIIFIIINLVFSYVTAIFFGEIISYILKITSLVTSMNESVDLFNLFNFVPVILSLIISFFVWRAYKSAFKIFDAWPGDIIYDRANKA